MNIQLICLAMLFCLFILPSMALGEGEMAPIVILRYKNEGGGSAGHTYRLQRDKTVIEDEDAEIIIDYSKLYIEKRELVSGIVKKYPIVSQTQSRSALKEGDRGPWPEFEDVFGSYDTQNLDALPGTKQYRRVRVVWGSKVVKFRSIGSPEIERYGIRFGVENLVCQIDDDYEKVDILENICSLRESFFAANPLLRRVDFCGLYGVVKGVPVSIEEKSGHRRVLVGIELN